MKKIEVVAAIVIELHEHIDHKWLDVEDIDGLDWAEADIPIVEKLAKESKGGRVSS